MRRCNLFVVRGRAFSIEGAGANKDEPELVLGDAAGEDRAGLGVGAGESALARLTANWWSVVESISGTLFGQKNNGR